MTEASALLVDCDVHCAVPSSADLRPYLEPHWQEFLKLGNFKAPPAVATTYPPWNPMFSAGPEANTVEALQAEVLQRSDAAILNCYYAVESFTHPYLADAIASAVNQWLRDEWLDRNDRLLASAVITPQYPNLAVEQIERISNDPRFVQILVPARSPAGYGNQRFWPIWEAAAAHGLTVGITGGGGTGTSPTPLGWLGSFFEEYAAGALNFQSHILSLATSGIFQRCPDLRFVIMESGWTWLPAWCWRMDQEWKAFQREVPWMHEPPSSYVRRHMRFTTTPSDAPDSDKYLEEVLEQLGAADLLMFGSDFPHRYGEAVDLARYLAPDELSRIMSSNACAWYRLDERLPALVPAGRPAM